MYTAQPAKEIWPEVLEADLFERLTLAGCVLTATNRLALELRRRFGNWQLARGREVWETPEVLPWSAWLRRQYLLAQRQPQGTGLPQLLSPEQGLVLWEEIVRDQLAGQRLLQVRETARNALTAWQLWQDYLLDQRDISREADPDTQAFLSCARDFERKCQKGQWLDTARLTRQLSSIYGQGLLDPPELICLAGFDTLSPAQVRLLETLAKLGSQIQTLGQGPQAGTKLHLVCRDTDQELDCLARWARAHLEDNPEARIGIIVPGLEEVREDLLFRLEGILQPGSLLSQGMEGPGLINVSLGYPLGSTAMVDCALSLLGLGRLDIPARDLGRLLRLRYWAGGESEAQSRGLLEAELYRQGEHKWTRPALRAFVERRKDGYCPKTIEALQALWGYLDTLPRLQSWRDWAASFSSLLDQVSWPGNATLSSVMYQTLEAWQGLLAALGRLDRVLGPADYHQALQRLEQLAGEQLFQPESGRQPVQVLGPLEAGGLRFDAAWVMGLTADVWPAAARPQPFLPRALQVRLDMPHCSAQRELRFARQLTRRLLHSAAEVVLSTPKRQGDRELQPSPLIKGVKKVSPKDLNLSQGPGLWAALSEGPGPVWELDRPAPAWPKKDLLPGGTGVLRAQARCPFQAFGRYRLQAESLSPPGPGLDALDRGSLAHKVLEFAWSRLKTLEALQGLSEEEVSCLAETAADEALDALAQKRPLTLAGAMRGLERRRLVRLVSSWIGFELARSPFEVLRQEYRFETTLAGARLQGVCDRIDQLADGRLVVIDYKTGELRPKDWFEGRLTEPQLPLYAVVAEERLAGILVARLKAGQMGYDGVVSDADIHPDLPRCQALPANQSALTWPEVLSLWRKGLEGLVQEFCSGHCPVRPTRPDYCSFCDLSPLCRLAEQRRRLKGSGPCGLD